MSTIIKYQNRKEEFISEQQALQLDYYSKIFYIDDKLKKEEIYRNNVLWGGEYYLSPDEDAITILTQLGAHLQWSLCISQQEVNGYILSEYRAYDGNLQQEPDYTKSIIDPTGRVETYVSYSSQTNLPVSAFKMYNFGGLQVTDEEDGILWVEDANIKFSFSENGLDTIRMNVGYINNTEIWDSVSHFQLDAQYFIDDMLPGNMFAYFINIEPVVPNF